MSNKQLILQIANKEFDLATKSLHEALGVVVQRKLNEKKKMIAASTFSESTNVEEANSPKDYSSGFLNVKHKGSHSIISYTGNMGSTEQTVAKEFDSIHGEGSFAKIRPHGEIHKDKAGNLHNDPSYSYVLKVPKKKFNSELNINEGKRWQALGQAIKNAGNPTIPIAVNAAMGAYIGGKPGAAALAGLAGVIHANHIAKDYVRNRDNQKFKEYHADKEVAKRRKNLGISEASAIEAAKEAEEKVKAAAEKHVKDRPNAKAKLAAARDADASHPSGKTFDKWKEDRAKRRKNLGISESKKLSPEEKKKAQDEMWNEIHSDHPDSNPKIEGTLEKIHAARAKQMNEGLMRTAINAISGKRSRIMKKVDSHITKAEKIAGKPGDNPILDTDSFSDFSKNLRSMNQSLDRDRVDRYVRTAKLPDKKEDASKMWDQTIAYNQATNWKQRKATGKFPQFRKEDTHDVSEGVMKIIKRAVTGQRGKLVKKIAAEFDKVENQKPDNLSSKLKRLQRMKSLTNRTLRAGGVASPRKNPKGLAE